MKQDFNISKTPHAQMHCEDGNECYCYGKVCLVSDGKGNCSAGNLFVNGRAFCGIPNAFNLDFGRVVCRELGFRDALTVTTSNTVGE